MCSSEAGGFGLVDGGGVEFAVGGVYDGFVVVYVERKVVDFLAAQSVYVALDHGVVAYLFVLVDFDVQGIGESAGRVGKRCLRPETGGASIKNHLSGFLSIGRVFLVLLFPLFQCRYLRIAFQVYVPRCRRK